MFFLSPFVTTGKRQSIKGIPYHFPSISVLYEELQPPLRSNALCNWFHQKVASRDHKWTLYVAQASDELSLPKSLEIACFSSNFLSQAASNLLSDLNCGPSAVHSRHVE
mmetsp:Transcript_36585/g.59148  ORF Transcript_36585/g.59148 Transcript_36585/m.59148 type:complete len:109 (-) Transcript_36585:114-440(-)